eukprot:Blabericola_migrator_1__8421@NODE_438_length_8472_cov_502_790006_g344_i0_p1_GENE_NODE_438_length_8472_cov_502_790006_g344_i0NODE_438_length_8472_cov_502_790006_g344_i0_p1_ORF_typecomplete_len541_score84_75DAO/PF01266_24/6_2e42Rieske/PF00355_26/4_4e03Rieske/PF00355_26/1e13Pyr_redox_3/PF13738_6/9_1e06Pyr_redox_3/PF13738_6/0_023Pyr_redox_2/PF07992_14/1_8e05Pyr_redox_2/PF07992_14/7_4NAD_binding_8/PF13450_6/1_1e06FAD_binding_3/PF01494_19/3_6e06Thi4/PF01946_17/4e06NAD_binding_9/PF13454_6/0_0064NAD_bin
MPDKFLITSGSNDSVWVHKDPYSNRPSFPKLTEDVETSVCIVGAGIVGISLAYELVRRNVEVILIEAREVLAGESSRTSGHLTSDLDDGYLEIKGKHGHDLAGIAFESHTYAVKRVGEISKELGIDCNYHLVPSYNVSQYQPSDPNYEQDVQTLKDEIKYAKTLGMDGDWKEDLKIKGWDTKVIPQGAVYRNQAVFHPTKYVLGVLKWLTQQSNFKCFTRTRMMSTTEPSSWTGGKIKVETDDGKTIKCEDVVMATCIPLQKLSVVAELVYNRSYCIAIRVPKGSCEDCLIYDSADVYKYVRYTECDEGADYMIVGGMDHKVGQGPEGDPFAELETWVRERFPSAGSVDYKWSGQIIEPVDLMAFIGKDPGCSHTWICTGDSGDGLTHALVAALLISEEIVTGKSHPWSSLYAPSRKSSLLKSAKELLTHDLQINSQYKRLLQTDITDIEDLAPGTGGVLNTKKPIAVFKTKESEVQTLSALCHHMKGVVCWNSVEHSWDCPVHGSRFSPQGVCLMGPAKAHLTPDNDAAKAAQARALAL